MVHQIRHSGLRISECSRYVGVSEYYPVGDDCLLYHTYWDGTAIDHSPAKNNGTLVTGATFGQLGGVNCLLLDGSAGKVNIATAIENLAPWTAIIWAYSDSTKGGNYQIGMGGGSGYYFMYQASTNDLYNASYGVAATFTGVAVGLFDKWQCWAVSYDKAAGICHGWYNGNKLADLTGQSTSGYTNVTTIGGYTTTDTTFTLKGAVGEVLVFNTHMDDAAFQVYYAFSKSRYGL